MRRLMAFSYKGGAGRSTALANIAAALAKKGQKVLVIDYDIQAPGLHLVFESGPRAGDPAGDILGLADYLLSDDPPERARTEYVLDLAGACREERTRDLLAGLDGRIHFLTGVSASPGEAFDPGRSGTRLGQLVDYLEEERAYDYVLIDSPSGVNERSEDVFDVSQLVLIFYRWSLQHVEGTEIVMSYLNEYIEDGELGERTYEIVGNAVPSHDLLDTEARDEIEAEVLKQYKQDVQDRLAQPLKHQYEVESTLYGDSDFGDHRLRQLERLQAAIDRDEVKLPYVIDETPVMKLKEFLAVLYSDDTMYERIAGDLVEGRILLPGESKEEV